MKAARPPITGACDAEVPLGAERTTEVLSAVSNFIGTGSPVRREGVTTAAA
jgi:hypothetical protein